MATVNDPVRVQEMVRRQVRRRRRWRRVRITLLVIVLAAVAGGAAVGIERLVVLAHKLYVEHHHPSARAAGGGRTSTTLSTTTTAPPGPGPCGSPQLSAVVYDWRETDGMTQEAVQLTNISPTTCSLSGYATIGVSAQSGTPLPAPTTDLPALGTVPASSEVTSAQAPVTVAPRSEAWFELSYPDICDQVLTPGATPTGAPNECYPGNVLEVTPSKGTEALLVTQPVLLTYGTAGFEVGPFQAGTPTGLTNP